MTTSRRQKCQRIRNLLIELFVGAVSPVNLMKNFPVFDKHHTSCPTGRLGGMSHHENRLSIQIDLIENVQKPVCRPGIQCTGRFIRQYQLRIRDQRPGHRSPLLLPAGNLVGKLFQDAANSAMKNKQDLTKFL